MGTLKWGVAAVLTVTLSACVSITRPPELDLAPKDRVVAFSSGSPGAVLPLGWQNWIISRFNRDTVYRMVDKDGVPILEAFADRSASGVLQEVSIDPAPKPMLSWKWRVDKLPEGTDISKAGRDDSPARVFVNFDGDKEKFDFEDRNTARLVKLFSGREMPYATLMYVWDSKLPPGTMLDNPHTGRVKMIVVESGPGHVGQWLNFERNLMDDFVKAFKEPPGKIISLGVMTDSNSTKSVITAQYGDIELRAAEPK